MSDPEVLEQKSLGNTSQRLLKSRNWVLTIWDDETLKKFIESNPTYGIYAPEVCPNTGRKHYQCYAHYSNTRNLCAMLKNYKGHNVEIAIGNHKQNQLYIKGPYSKNGKEKPFNPEHVEIGTIPHQGKRNDLQEFHEAIQMGKRGRDLSVDHLCLRAKYPRLEQTLICEDDEQKAIDLHKSGFKNEVHVRWGEPQVGKSRYIYEKHRAEDIYEVNTGDGSNKSLWWDAYRGHEVILINDFDGTEISWKYMLRLLDRYPFRMQVKGGYVWKLAKYIYITANDPPERWYPAHNHHLKALMDRFTTVTEVKEYVAPTLRGLRALSPGAGADTDTTSGVP